MLFSPVYAESHPRRSVASFKSTPPYSLRADHFIRNTVHHSDKSFPLISFADPHPLTLLKSYRFKNRGERGPEPRLSPTTLSPLSATLMNLRVSVATKRLTPPAKPFRCNTYKKQGGTPFKPKAVLSPVRFPFSSLHCRRESALTGCAWGAPVRRERNYAVPKRRRQSRISSASQLGRWGFFGWVLSLGILPAMCKKIAAECL